MSKIILQETVLGLAEFYSRFNEIYFPVRLDQRGRLYCSPAYLNYQSNDLAKALLLFAIPGIIKRDDKQAVKYLKAYGANCYGGRISKASINTKIERINNNVNDIINFDNGKLLNKAQDKLLFLAFCMEFKRYYEFYVDENQMDFYTYLPIQMDATCNGMQHMLLLSNEEDLFTELNLTSKNHSFDKDDIKPNDLYNFVLYKLINLFESKIKQGII